MTYKMRRIALHDGNDVVIRTMDISDIDHANTMLTVTINVEERCDMGHWHPLQIIDVNPWGNKIEKEKK